MLLPLVVGREGNYTESILLFLLTLSTEHRNQQNKQSKPHGHCSIHTEYKHGHQVLKV